MDYDRLASAGGKILDEAGAADMRNRVAGIARLVRYVQGLIDAELQRLGYGVEVRPEDRAILDKINAVSAGDECKV